MPASYPTSAKSFTSKSAGQSIDPNHVNDLQLEVTAIEQDILAGLPATRGGTGATSLTNHGVVLGQGTSAVAVTSAGTSGQVLTSNGASADPTFQDVTATFARSLCQGRLSLTSGSPVTTTDVTAATTLYWALYDGNQVGLYTGSAWQAFAVAELSIAVPASTDTNYDVFIDYNAGTPQLALTAWSNATTRATALTKQDGVYVLTGSTGKRYVGSFRTTGSSGQTEDSVLKRFVWNYYHRVNRPLRVTDSANSWNYSLAAWQQANASAANQVALVIGVSEDIVSARVDGWAVSTSGNDWGQVAIGLDSTSAAATGFISPRANIGSENSLHGSWNGFPGIGYHYLAWLESTAAGGTATWYGDNNTPTLTQTGLQAVMRG